MNTFRSLILFCVFPLFLIDRGSAATLKGYWEFANSTAIGQGTVLAGGVNSPTLAIEGTAPTHASSVTDANSTTLNGVITTAGGTANRLRLTHGIAPNGGSSSYVRQYTILYDVFSPAASRSSWRCLLQTNTSNSNDGDYFIRNNDDKLGVSGIGYSTNAITDSRWNRIVITVNAGSSINAYVNGAFFYTHTANTADGTYALNSQVLFFADNDNENASLSVGAVAIWDGQLTAAEVAALGQPGTAIPTNSPPTITEGNSTSIIAQVSGPAVSKTINASDSNNDPVTWSISTQPTKGTVNITSSSNTTCTFSYTPGGTYTGNDSFVVRAFDGFSASTITVNVTLPYPAPVALWEFETASLDPTLATIGTNLTVNGTIAAASGIATGDGALEIGAGSNLLATNPVGANGGGSFTNRYALMWDVFIPTTAAGQWKCLLQTATANNNDGDLFINTSGQLGTTGGLGGYTTNTLAAGNWYRVILNVVNGTTNGTTIWVNGSKWLTTTTSGGIDGRYAFENRFLLFADEDGEDTTIRTSNVALWSDALTDAQIALLGSAATGRITTLPKPIANNPPIITQGATLNFNANINSTTFNIFNATDSDNDNLTWSVSVPAAHGVASISASSNTGSTVSYTPNAGYVGTDTFTVRVADARSSASIVVTANVTNTAPVIAEGASFSLSSTINSPEQSVVLHATDAENNPLTWSITTLPTNGTAQLSNSSNSQTTLKYTPAANFAGVDSLTVRVSDGSASADIQINITVSDPSAAPVLTIVSPYGTATPGVGTYSHPRGTALTNSVIGEGNATMRRNCVGWTLVGDGPYSGTGSNFAMTLTRNSTLTWLWQTEYRVETGVVGTGTINVASGWFAADTPIQITATPGAGQHFAGWTGDTAGCIIGGKSILVPVNRPYATIRANFATSQNFTVIAFPDTQNYTAISNPSDLFTRQTQWILNNKETLNIKFLTHLGDIVDSATSTSQWKRATDAMDLLNSKLPYGVCPGNHDINGTSTHYLDRFGPAHPRWIDPATGQTYDWYKGTSPRGYSNYQVLNLNGRDYMFLHIDCDCPDSDMAWAATVLSQHPRTVTMLTTHDYMAETGSYSSAGSGTGQRGRVNYSSPYVNFAPDRNTVTEIWNTLVKPFNQVYMVICGHNFAQYNVESVNAAGKIVHEVLADYQTLPNGGNGFLRIMEFRPSQNQIYNTTYSPYLGRYMSNTSSPQAQITSDNTGMLDLTDKNGGEFSLITDFDTRFNQNLTIVSSQATVSPAVGTTSVEYGTPVVAKATDRIDGQTRYRATGWALTGTQSAAGTGKTASFTMGGNQILTWNWATEYYLDTQTTGRGIISVNSGWQPSGSNVSILAQPDFGFAFVGWSGDIAGCTVSGTSISIPMTRGRGPVTAEFTSSLPSFNVLVASPYNSISPAPATYTFEQGTVATFTASDLTVDNIRRVCTGWTATGAINQTGSGREAVLTVSGNTTLTWNWKTQYLLETAVVGSGTVTAAEWVDENSAASVTATPSVGSGFNTWSGDTALGTATDNVFNISSMTRPVRTLTANFVTGFHSLAVVSTQTGITPEAGTTSLAHGTVINFSADVVENGRARYVPSKWTLTTGGVTTEGTTPTGSFTLTDDATLAWSWQSEVLLEFVAGVEGVVLPTNAAGWRKLAEDVPLQAVPRNDFTFARWTGDFPNNPTTSSATLKMSNFRIVTADFTPIKAPGGTPKWWLDRHAKVVAGNLAAAELDDADFDGQRAADEFVAGMDDLDATKTFGLTGVQPVSSTQVSLSWPTATGRLYSIRSIADLRTPSATTLVLGNITASTANTVNGITSAQISFSETSRFFNIQIALPVGGEMDADSLAASFEPLPGSLQREMKFIPAGSFAMGDHLLLEAGATPVHTVHTSALFMDKFEVTYGDWKTVATWAAAHGYDIPITLNFQPPLTHPAPGVSWYEAVKWCNARSEMEGRVPAYYTDATATTVYRTGELDLTADNVNWIGNGYRLPTEAEWEKACRGGLANKIYSWGDEEPFNRSNHWQYQILHNHNEDPYPISSPVGYFSGGQEGGGPDVVNGYGLYDMTGNAWEWNWDRAGHYAKASDYDPKGPDIGDRRMTRGGSWWNNVADLGNAHRYPFPPGGENVYGQISFRCVRAAGPNEQ